MYLLNISGFPGVSASFGLVLNLAFCSSSSSRLENPSKLRIRVSSVYIPTTSNVSFKVVIIKHRLYINVTIDSFS